MAEQDPDTRLKPTQQSRAPNISTENQPDGSARRPSDTLDRDRSDGDNRGHRSSEGSGEVKGSGAGAGGGNPEDFDSDETGGGTAQP